MKHPSKRPMRRSIKRVHQRAQRPLCCESLEQRHLLAADLAITELQLVDAQNQPTTGVVVGEMARVRANWVTTDLTPGQQYRVKFEMNGISVYSNVVTGSPGANLSYFWWRGVGYSPQGLQTITVTIDGDNQIFEANESNNAATIQFTPQSPDLIEPFLWPIGGQPFKDWSLVNYSDVDLRSGIGSDYLGGPYQYDGHDAFDLSLPNFARMEMGVPVYAAAAGTVLTVADGNFDRNTGSSSTPANYVAVDHGNGWVVYYYHFQRETITVQPGQSLTAGQTLGLAGSSGNSSDAHLHFALYKNGTRVEPMYASDQYFIQEFPYQGDLPTTVTASGITDAAPWNDFKESPNDIRSFRTDSGEDTWLWYRLSHLNIGDVTRIEWFRPGGAFDGAYGFTATDPVRYGGYGWTRNTRNFPGTWRVDVKINGVIVATESFEVISSGGEAAIDVRHNGNRIIDGRSTPIEFATVAKGGFAPRLSFSVQNRGSAPLDISAIELPEGFSTVGLVPSVINVNSTNTLQIQMDSVSPGTKYGEVRIHSNDADEPVFSFIVAGEVTGSQPLGTPVITTSLPALALENGTSHASLFTDASIADPDATEFSGGQLMAVLATGARQGDRLALPHNLGLTSPVTVSADVVSYLGNRVGRLSKDGSEGQLVIEIDSPTDQSTINALAREIQFWSTESETVAGRREVELRFVDSDGHPAQPRRRSVITDGSLLMQPMPAPTIQDVAINGGSQSRAQISYLDVQFSAQVDHALLASAFTLTNVNTNQSVGQVNILPTDSEGKTSVRLTFAGALTVTRQGGDLQRANSLADGNYRLEIDHQKVALASTGLTMLSDFVFGGQSASGLNDQFFRLFGDIDGDRDVDAQDFGRFASSFLKLDGMPEYDPGFDYDGDGDIDGNDNGQFRRQLRKRLAP